MSARLNKKYFCNNTVCGRTYFPAKPWEKIKFAPEHWKIK